MIKSKSLFSSFLVNSETYSRSAKTSLLFFSFSSTFALKRSNMKSLRTLLKVSSFADLSKGYPKSI